MPRINLLPWRAELRKERQKNFAIASVAAVLMGALIMLLVNIYLQGRIDYQKARNQRLEQEIARLDNEIKEIRNLRLRKERLLARMSAIDDLQRARPEAVYLFDQLVAVMPEGVYLTEFSQTGRRLLFRGMAESSTRVSALMRNIDDSPYLGNPILQVVQSGQQQRGGSQPDIGRRAQFSLAGQQLSTTDDEGGE
jgi:type IV pilus assembly protein PilN